MTSKNFEEMWHAKNKIAKSETERQTPKSYIHANMNRNLIFVIAFILYYCQLLFLRIYVIMTVTYLHLPQKLKVSTSLSSIKNFIYFPVYNKLYLTGIIMVYNYCSLIVYKLVIEQIKTW